MTLWLKLVGEFVTEGEMIIVVADVDWRMM